MKIVTVGVSDPEMIDGESVRYALSRGERGLCTIGEGCDFCGSRNTIQVANEHSASPHTSTFCEDCGRTRASEIWTTVFTNEPRRREFGVEGCRVNRWVPGRIVKRGNKFKVVPELGFYEGIEPDELREKIKEWKKNDTQ